MANDRVGGHKEQIVVELVAPPSLALGQPLAITANVTPLMDATDVQLRWSLPPGVTLLDGPSEESLGSLTANQKMTLVRQIRIDVAGVHRVGVEAKFSPHPAASLGLRVCALNLCSKRRSWARIGSKSPSEPESGVRSSCPLQSGNE